MILLSFLTQSCRQFCWTAVVFKIFTSFVLNQISIKFSILVFELTLIFGIKTLFFMHSSQPDGLVVISSNCACQYCHRVAGLDLQLLPLPHPPHNFSWFLVLVAGFKQIWRWVGVWTAQIYKNSLCQWAHLLRTLAQQDRRHCSKTKC